MDPMLILSLIAISIGAGLLGNIFGIGGGIIFIPILTIIYGLTASEAVAVSLVGILATSIIAASTYIKSGTSNIRLGLALEITTAIGATIGALISGYIQNDILLCIFVAVLIIMSIQMILSPEKSVGSEKTGRLAFLYHDRETKKESKYHVDNIKSGMAICTGIGAMASMTGIGGGSIKVPMMNLHMHVPIIVATTTSNYMIGITAFSGAIVYFISGEILLEYAASVAIGAFIGSIIGSKLSARIKSKSIRKYFSILLIVIAIIVLLDIGGIL